jgi:hypothetical protein
LLGNSGQAWTYYEQALATASRIRFRPEIALTRLAMAELLNRFPQEEGRGWNDRFAEAEPNRSASRSLRAEASEPVGRNSGRSEVDLDLVVAELRAMGMQPALERALRLQEHLQGERSGQRTPAASLRCRGRLRKGARSMEH